MIRVDDENREASFDYAARGERYWNTLKDLFESSNFSYRDILTHFPAYVLRRQVERYLSHYELFKQVVDLPGCVVELGVFRGTGLFTWSTLMDIFCPFDRARRVFGFDTWEGLKGYHERDGKVDRDMGKLEGGWQASRHAMETLVELHNELSPLHMTMIDSVMPNDRVEIINGDVRETIPQFIEQHPGLAISLLHFDMDIYDPTKKALELLYPRVVQGGIVCFDEYGVMPWEGETRAVDEFFADLSERPVLRKHPFTQQPSAWFVKGS
jgi:hypothetical protein